MQFGLSSLAISKACVVRQCGNVTFSLGKPFCEFQLEERLFKKQSRIEIQYLILIQKEWFRTTANKVFFFFCFCHKEKRVVEKVLLGVGLIVIVALCCLSSKKKIEAKCATDTAMAEVIVEA